MHRTRDQFEITATASPKSTIWKSWRSLCELVLVLVSWVSVSFKLSNLAKAEKSIDVRENDKAVGEIDIYLAEVLRLIDPFDFAPAVHFAQRIDITSA